MWLYMYLSLSCAISPGMRDESGRLPSVAEAQSPFQRAIPKSHSRKIMSCIRFRIEGIGRHTVALLWLHKRHARKMSFSVEQCLCTRQDPKLSSLHPVRKYSDCSCMSPLY